MLSNYFWGTHSQSPSSSRDYPSISNCASAEFALTNCPPPEKLLARRLRPANAGWTVLPAPRPQHPAPPIPGGYQEAASALPTIKGSFLRVRLLYTLTPVSWPAGCSQLCPRAPDAARAGPGPDPRPSAARKSRGPTSAPRVRSMAGPRAAPSRGARGRRGGSPPPGGARTAPAHPEEGAQIPPTPDKCQARPRPNRKGHPMICPTQKVGRPGSAQPGRPSSHATPMPEGDLAVPAYSRR